MADRVPKIKTKSFDSSFNRLFYELFKGCDKQNIISTINVKRKRFHNFMHQIKI